jgi:hypothetical protein
MVKILIATPCDVEMDRGFRWDSLSVLENAKNTHWTTLDFMKLFLAKTDPQS